MVPVLVVVVLVLGVAAAAFIAAGGGVRRNQVERFAERQAVLLTPHSGPAVGRALAVTHRWRRLGLAIGLVLAAVWSTRHGRVSVDAGAMFLGWFVGAVAAQWRTNVPDAPGTRRRGELSARSLSTYVTPRTRHLLVATLGVLAVTAIVSGILLVADPAYRRGWIVSAVECVVGLCLLALATRRVVDRQRPTDPDLREADDALRGHSLTMLVGSAIALASMPIAWFVSNVIDKYAPHTVGPSISAAVLLVLMVFFMVLGWLVVTRSPSVRLQRWAATHDVPAEREAASA